MRYQFVFVLIVVVTVGSLHAGGSQEPTPPAETVEVASDSIDPEVAEQLTAIGMQPMRRAIEAEAFELESLAGPSINLSDFRGQMVLLNFWASWCGPCVMEMPSMQDMYETLRDGGMEIIAVNVQEERPVVEAFVDQRGFSFRVLLDPAGKTSFNYAVRGLPTSYLIGRSGRLLAVKVGFHLWDEPEVLETLQALLEKGV